MTAKLLTVGLVISMAFGPVVRAEENIKAEVGIDVLAVREEGFWAHLSRNWWKYLLAVGGAFAVDRAAEANDWLWYHGQDDDKTDRVTGDGNTQSANDAHNNGIDAAMQTTITGDGNTVVYDITVVNVPME
jgi:hypothetical protein